VPQPVIDTLRQTPVRYTIRQAYAGLDKSKRKRSGAQAFWILYTQYQLSQAAGKRFFPLDFLRFLRARWALEGGVGQTLNYMWLRVRGVDANKVKQMV
jgi:hypothetical protein